MVGKAMRRPRIALSLALFLSTSIVVKACRSRMSQSSAVRPRVQSGDRAVSREGIENLRLEAAKFMLEQGRLPVEEIAREARFGDRERSAGASCAPLDRRPRLYATLRTRLPLFNVGSSLSVHRKSLIVPSTRRWREESVFYKPTSTTKA
jgi:AraC-like DNA-binding protein